MVKTPDTHSGILGSIPEASVGHPSRSSLWSRQIGSNAINSVFLLLTDLNENAYDCRMAWVWIMQLAAQLPYADFRQLYVVLKGDSTLRREVEFTSLTARSSLEKTKIQFLR